MYALVYVFRVAHFVCSLRRRKQRLCVLPLLLLHPDLTLSQKAELEKQQPSGPKA